MRNSYFLLLILATILMSTEGYAQSPAGGAGERGARGRRQGGQERGEQAGQPAPAPPLMAVLDTNGDGKLSKAEIENSSKVLMALDKNEDGFVEASEVVAPARRSSGQESAANAFVQRLMGQDADGDGKLSKEEAGERMAQFFGNLDTNSDGFLTKDEMEAMARRFGGGGGRGQGGGRGAGRGAGGGGGYTQPKSKDNRPPFDDN